MILIWAFVREINYIVSKRDIQTFLNSHKINQLHQPNQKIITSRAIQVKAPHIKYMADLIFFNTDTEEIILFTMIDIFSKYAYVVKINNKSTSTILKTLKQIYNKLDVYPKLLQFDNANEFHNKNIINYLKTKNTKAIFSRVYRSTDNAFIERFNRTIKTNIMKYINLNKKRHFYKF